MTIKEKRAARRIARRWLDEAGFEFEIVSVRESDAGATVMVRFTVYGLDIEEELKKVEELP